MSTTMTKPKPPNATAFRSSPNKVLRSSNLAATRPAHLRTGHSSGSESGPHNRQRSAPKKQTMARESSDADSDLDLRQTAPRSAPVKSYLSQDLWEMPDTPSKSAKANTGPDVLTWQQEFFKQQSTKTPDRTPKGKRISFNNANSAAKTSPPRKNKKRERTQSGKTNDDSGSDSAAQIKKAEADLQRLSLEVDDLFTASPSPATLRATITTPTASPIPKKKAQRPQSAITLLKRSQSATVMAGRAQDDLSLSMHTSMNISTPSLRYAGPEFHNSPSPASLPMPAFRRAVKAA